EVRVERRPDELQIARRTRLAREVEDDLGPDGGEDSLDGVSVGDVRLPPADAALVAGIVRPRERMELRPGLSEPLDQLRADEAADAVETLTGVQVTLGNGHDLADRPGSRADGRVMEENGAGGCERRL